VTIDGNAGAPRFSVGRVISQSLSVVFGNLFRFLAIILVVGVPLFLLIVVGVMAVGLSLRETGAGFTIQNPDIAGTLFMLAFVFLFLLAYFLIQSALTYGALQHLRGQPRPIGACLTAGFKALPRVFLASLLLFVAVVVVGFVVMFILQALLSGLGLLGILVGFVVIAALLYVVTLLWVFIPAIVIERVGAIDCFGRSMTLTKGHRWGIFGILVLLGVVNAVVTTLTRLLAEELAPVAGSVLDVAWSLFFLALTPVLAAVGYFYLRVEKEGVAIDDVVRVFD